MLSCKVSLNNWGLSITCDFAFSVVLLPWRTMVLMERVKSFISSSDIFIFLVFLVVFCMLQLFFSFSFFSPQFVRNNLATPKLVLPASKQKHLYKSYGYKLVSDEVVRIKWVHVFMKFVRGYMALLSRSDWLWHLIQYF